MEKHFQHMLFVFFCFLWLFLIWKGDKAKGESVSLNQPIEITIPAALEVQLSPGQTRSDNLDLVQEANLHIKSNTPWKAEIRAFSSLSTLPEGPSPLSGPANSDQAFQVVPFQVRQELSWADFGIYQLLITYEIKQGY